MAWSWTGDKPRQGATRPRRQERFPTHGLNCPLGTVLDLSGSGMRVRRESKPPLNVGDPMAMTIGSESQSVKVSGKVAWIKRVSWRSFEVGVQFVDVRPGISAALVQLAQYGFISANSSPAENNAAPKVSPSPKADKKVKAAMEVEDLYAVLGVAANASDEQIRHAYRSLALRYHPDVSAEPAAAEKFALIAKSYSVLKDSDLRKRYDQMVAGCIAA